MSKQLKVAGSAARPYILRDLHDTRFLKNEKWEICCWVAISSELSPTCEFRWHSFLVVGVKGAERVTEWELQQKWVNADRTRREWYALPSVRERYTLSRRHKL